MFTSLFSSLLGKAKILTALGVAGGSIALAAPTASARGFENIRVITPAVQIAETPVCAPALTPVIVRHLPEHRFNRYPGGQLHRHGPVASHHDFNQHRR